MNLEKHLELKGKHAFLSPSNYHWIRWPKDKLIKNVKDESAKELGTRLHALAEEHINLKWKASRTKKTVDHFINDAIGYGMTPEQVLYYDEYCFGTADALSFKDNLLRIHDLKTGETKASFDQLLIYAALFCLQYKVNPIDISIELRIYQYDDVAIKIPEPEEVSEIMDIIVENCKIIHEVINE